jgi:hypothetical protein
MTADDRRRADPEHAAPPRPDHDGIARNTGSAFLGLARVSVNAWLIFIESAVEATAREIRRTASALAGFVAGRASLSAR